MPRHHRAATLLTALALAAPLVLAACSGGSAKPDAGHPAVRTSQGAAGSHGAKAEAAPVQNPRIPQKIKNTVPLRKSVVLTSCAKAAGGWQAGGSVTNSGATAATRTITVFFTTHKATVQDWAATTVHVPARGHTRWTAKKAFPAAAGTLCVLRGVS